MTADAAATRAEPAIGDYAVIGNCRTAALIDKAGSLSWLCVPRFDSESVFAALLDPERGGRFAIAPVDAHSVSRQYAPGTNVLETRFETATGVCVLRDAMTVCSLPEQHR